MEPIFMMQYGEFAVADYLSKKIKDSVAEVLKVEFFAEEDVPLPLAKTKHIIRKCTDDNFDSPEVV